MNLAALKPGWRIVKFGDVVNNANLVERDPINNGIERIVGLDHLEPENLHIRRWNSPEDGTSFTRKFVPGQTLFGKRRAYQRKVAFAEFEGICSGDILTFESKDKQVLLPELLPFICQTEAFFDHALGTSAGSLSPRTSWKALKNFEFPLPPLKEQKRFAEILWAADEAVEGVSRLEIWADKSLSILLAGKFPKRSEGPSCFVFLENLCAKLPQSGIYKSETFFGSGIKIVKMGQLFGYDLINDEIEMDRIELSDDEIRRFQLTSDDLLFGRRSIVLEGAGKCSMVGETHEPVVFESSILRITINQTKSHSAYVFGWFQSLEGKKELRRIRSFTTVAGITGTDLKKLRVPLLPENKQIEIIEILENYRTKIIEIEDHKKNSIEMLKSIRESLVGKANA